MPASADQDKLIREKTFLLMVPLFAIAGLLWACIYYYYGAKTASAIPGSYGVTSFLSLLIYRWHKNYNIFRAIQLALILLLPCLLHLALGDFVSSSAVIIWATFCPLGALAFQNTRAAGYWAISVHHLRGPCLFSRRKSQSVTKTYLPAITWSLSFLH
jgi:hypothetical protein